MKVGEGVMVASVEPTARVKVRDKPARCQCALPGFTFFDAKTEVAI